MQYSGSSRARVTSGDPDKIAVGVTLDSILSRAVQGRAKHRVVKWDKSRYFYISYWACTKKSTNPLESTKYGWLGHSFLESPSPVWWEDLIKPGMNNSPWSGVDSWVQQQGSRVQEQQRRQQEKSRRVQEQRSIVQDFSKTLQEQSRRVQEQSITVQ